MQNTYSNNTNFEPDYIWGLEQEILTFPLLKQHLLKNIEHVSLDNRNAKFDFKTRKYNVEQKSRRNKSYTYNTTEITEDKCLELDGKRTIHVFNFTDKLMYIIFNKELYDTFEWRIKARNGDPKAVKKHIYIPVKLLIEICKDHRPKDNGCLINMTKENGF